MKNYPQKKVKNVYTSSLTSKRWYKPFCIVLTILTLVLFFGVSFFVGYGVRGCSRKNSVTSAYADELLSVSYRSSLRSFSFLGGVNGSLGNSIEGSSPNNREVMFFVDWLIAPRKSISIRFGTYYQSSPDVVLTLSDYQTFDFNSPTFKTEPQGLFYKHSNGTFMNSPALSSTYSSLYQVFFVGQVEFDNYPTLNDTAPVWSDLSYIHSDVPRGLSYGSSDNKIYIWDVSDFVVLTFGFDSDFTTRANTIKFYFPCSFNLPTSYMTSLPPFNRVFNLRYYSEHVGDYDSGWNDGFNYGMSLSDDEKIANSYDNGYSAGYNIGYSKGLNSSLSDISPFAVLVNGVDNFMQIKIFGTSITLGLILSLCFGFVLLGVAFKIFFHS